MASEIKIVWFNHTQDSTAKAEKTLGELVSDGWTILFVAGTTEEHSSSIGGTFSSGGSTWQVPAGFAVLEKQTGGGGNIR